MKRRRFLLRVVTLPLLWIPGVVSAEADPVPYVEFPFDVSQGASSLNEKFRTKEDRVYSFDLRFEYVNPAEQDRLDTLVGDGSRYPDGRYGKPGIIIPIHLKIISVTTIPNSDPVFEKTVETRGIWSHGIGWKVDAGDYRRRVAEVRLPPGSYRVQVSTLQDISSFVGVRTHFGIGYDARATPFR